jgi:hypothetical protein
MLLIFKTCEYNYSHFGQIINTTYSFQERAKNFNGPKLDEQQNVSSNKANNRQF